MTKCTDLIAMLYPEIIVLKVDFEIRQNELLSADENSWC